MDGDKSETAELPLEELEARITELCGHLNAAQYRWLLLIREFDRRCGWGDGKLRSCAHWLNFKCGLNLGAAREKVRVAHALKDLPLIAASMARGELSYSKVRALTRVACRATERDLLNIALHGTAYHVERTVRGVCPGAGGSTHLLPRNGDRGHPPGRGPRHHRADRGDAVAGRADGL
jgi:hypothetical protein